MIWEDVSANYSGVFFRVVGGEAAPFGEIQMENTNRISKVNSVHDDNKEWKEASKNETPGHHNTKIPSKGSSKYIFTGATDGYIILVNFESSGGRIDRRTWLSRFGEEQANFMAYKFINQKVQFYLNK